MVSRCQGSLDSVTEPVSFQMRTSQLQLRASPSKMRNIQLQMRTSQPQLTLYSIGYP